VAYPDGDVFFTTKGNPGMATAGCGDVLAGTIAGLMEQTEEGLAPLLGVWLHGTAGDLAYEELGEGLLAGDILQRLPAARQRLRRSQLR
jgi:NAD(P)H-hydrate epimerase